MADVTNTNYASEAIHGYGAQLLVGDGASPEGFFAVYGVKRIVPGATTLATFDKTHLRSKNAHKEKGAGMRDSEPFQLECIWKPDHPSQANVDGVADNVAPGLLFLNRTRRAANFKILLPDGSPGTEWPFNGLVTKFQPGEIGEDDGIMVTIEITPTQDYSDDLP